jgi:hypothetical protein
MRNPLAQSIPTPVPIHPHADDLTGVDGASAPRI